MPKVLFIAPTEQFITKDMPYLPAIGDTVPLFHHHSLTVINRCWFPQELGYKVAADIDVVIILK